MTASDEEVQGLRSRVATEADIGPQSAAPSSPARVEAQARDARRLLGTHSSPWRVVNNDGTETWHGLTVVVPAGLIPDGERPVEVRSRALIARDDPGARAVNGSGNVLVVYGHIGSPGDLRIILAPPPPTWTPPASLPDGDYEWNGESLSKGVLFVLQGGAAGERYRDWTDPPLVGVWRVKDGKATYFRKGGS